MHQAVKLTFRHRIIFWTMVWLTAIAIGLWVASYWLDRQQSPYAQSSVENLEKLMARANQYIMEEQADSALIAYAEVANASARETEDERVKLRARSYNNMGYVLMYMKHDYTGAYKFFLKALADAKAAKFEKMYAYVYLNLGNVKLHASPDSALILYRDAFHAALATESFDIVNISYSNMLNVAMNEGSLDMIKSEIDAYEVILLPDSVALNQFTRRVHNGAKQMLKGNYDEASENFRVAADEVDTSLTPTYFEAQAHGNRAEALLAKGDTIAAIKVMEEMEKAAFRSSTPEVRWNLYGVLSTIYSKLGKEEIAMKYHIHHLELADSIFGYRAGHHLDNIETQTQLDEMAAHYDDLHRRHLRSRLLLSTGGVIIILILLFSVITYFQKQRATELLKNLYLRDRDLRQFLHASEAAIEKTPNDENKSTTKAEEVPLQKTSTNKYRTSSLTSDDKKHYAALLTKIATESDALYKVGFSIEQLAEIAGLKEKEVSQIINEMWQMNFNAWLNSYRCREASARLSDPAFDVLTIEAIGEGLGFRSRSHFASVFKQSTGMTPAEYRRVSRLV